ncbi:MAG: hypothetical protein M1828_007061 [Chrysothrix sp. TS-e1954]|nr:MAG: hypothetical protein M1828_007061 [Chrysothrix sp. TS-e1954]
MLIWLIAPFLALFAYAADPIPPSKDTFYTPTGDWKSAKPGTVLAHREVPQPLKNVTYSEAYQLLYRTTDSLGDATAAVTTVIIPQQNANYSRLLSYQIVYDTADFDCSPSYILQEGGPNTFDNGFTYGLMAGAIINSPDYEGPKAAFTAGVISGQATLDSIRAALSSTSITKLKSDATVAMWGYSGGALATEWASELQHSYAPELNILGSAMGGLTPNVTSVAMSVNKHADAGLVASGILGLAAAYPNISTFINSSFTSPADKTKFYQAKKNCLVQESLEDQNQDIFGYFKEGSGILTDPRTAFAVKAGGIMGIHGMPLPKNKLYVYKSTLDEVSPIADTDALVAKYCAQGASIHYVKDNYGSHMAEATNGGLGALEFLAGILDGQSDQKEGCFIEIKNKAGNDLSSSSIAATTTVMSAIATGSATSSETSGSGGGSGGGSGAGSTTSRAAGAESTNGAGTLSYRYRLCFSLWGA